MNETPTARGGGEQVEAAAQAINRFHHGPGLPWDEASDALKTTMRAEAMAVILALKLTEETCCEAMYREQEETGKYNVYTCSDSEQSCRTRFVSKWSAR